MKVVELFPKMECEDIAKALRNIADDIDAGAYGFDPDAAVLVLTAEKQERIEDGFSTNFAIDTFSLGKAVGNFYTKGILASAMADL